MTPPPQLVKRSGKPQGSLRWVSHLALVASKQKSINLGQIQCSISTRLCSQTVGRKGLYRRTSGMQSLSFGAKTREKIRLFKLLRHHSARSFFVMARVLLNRLIPTIAQENTPENQCGFGSDKRTAHVNLVPRQIQGKGREHNLDLNAAFVGLTKAF